jgi:hypothetical protein
VKEKEKEKEGRKEVGRKSKLRRILEIVDNRERFEKLEKQIKTEINIFCIQQVQYICTEKLI